MSKLKIYYLKQKRDDPTGTIFLKIGFVQEGTDINSLKL